MSDVVECPIVDWYKFHKCDIRTCKNHTTETKHQCIEIDRKRPEGTKQFSDAELNLYKFRQRKISTRLVQIHRKNAIQSVKAVIILKKYVEWIAENYKSGARFTCKPVLMLERKYPLKIKRLGWKNWMWEYLLDDQVWNKFAAKSDGECKAFEVHQLLGIELGHYEQLVRLFQPKARIEK